MAFHVACPITCLKICYCTHGTPLQLRTQHGQDAFWKDIQDLERLLAKPAFLAAGGEETIDVLVPRLTKHANAKGECGWESGEERSVSLSKKAGGGKKATMADIATAESGTISEQGRKSAEATRRERGELDIPDGVPQIVCDLCLVGEAIGSKKAERMIPCPKCGKRYHRTCIKRWATNRDLFDWSSWVCCSCRVCEACRHTGEPNKLMFCKRCDDAYHSYCQQPVAKQASKGPFLCPKHTICHGCGSRVPGSGISSRWFMGYTNCDACGRLFIKGNFCPVCLKVYRDSESTPMVCCDKCEHWIHCRCDGISDEKYHEFQLNNDLHYICAVCRGECSRVKDLDDAIKEIWRRRDEADREAILQNQAAAGLPSKEENMKLCPSDDESNLMDDHFLKKVAKPLPLKGSTWDKKSTKKTDGVKLKAEKHKKDGSMGVVNKLKITLPVTHSREQRATVEPGIAGLEKVQKKKKDDGVAKLTKYMIQARESKATSNMKMDGADEAASGVHYTEKDLSFPFNGIRADEFGTRGVTVGQNRILKLVSKGYEKPGAKLVLHVSSKQKGFQNKVKMKTRVPAPAMMGEGSDHMKSKELYSDEDEPDDHNFHNNYPVQTRVAIPRMEGAVNQHRPSDLVRYVNVCSQLEPDSIHMKGNRAAMRHDPEEPHSNNVSYGRQGAALFSVRKKGAGMEMATTKLSQANESVIPRKKLKSSEAVDSRDSLANVPLKLRLKRPGSDNGVELDTLGKSPSNHGNENGARGPRSKRKKHHLLED